MSEEMWEKQHKEWIKNIFMQPGEKAPNASGKLWTRMNEMVGSYYTGLPSLENAEAAAEGGNPLVSGLELQEASPVGVPASGRFHCQQCGMSFATKSAHTSHTRSHGRVAGAPSPAGPGAGAAVPASGAPSPSPSPGADPYRCDVCRKTFAVPARLVRHYRTHTGERPFECEFCHKMFSVKENLQVHRRIHTKERPYRCDVCGRAFEHSGKLHRHMRIHTGERPHACSVCGKTFIQSGQLVIHLRTHTGEKPYRCAAPGCGKGFTCSKQLKVHSRTHTGEKPYHCDICFRDFGYNHVLKLHRVQHYGAKCYKCTICEETFKSKKEMEAHIKGHASDVPDCPSSSSASPVQHISQHQIQHQHQQHQHQQPQHPSEAYGMREPAAESLGLDPALLAAAAAAAAREPATPSPSSSPSPSPSPERPPYAYEQLSVMRHHAYFAPRPVPEFRPSFTQDSNIVKCVEAALAVAEDKMTLSAPSTDTELERERERSSSPDDMGDMCHRDMLSLPLRKRKMYMKPLESGAPMRMNSVIQFARAS